MARSKGGLPQPTPSPPAAKKDERRGRLTAFFTDWNPSYLGAPKSRGLFNKLNRCYRNAILTTLFHQPVFVNWLDLHRQELCPLLAIDEECLACRLALLSQEYWSERSHDSLNEELQRFWAACSGFWDVKSEDQEDCMEFLTSLLQAIKSSLEPSLGYNGSLSHMFQSITMRHTVCHNCGHGSDSAPDQTYFLGAAPGKKGRPIEECIDQYMDEKVEDYNCDNCKQKTEITRALCIDDSPEVLFVQVNRFHPVKQGKITQKVFIEEYLDLTKHLVKRANRENQRLRYQLTAVVSHKGPSVKGGHYISCVKRPNGTWAQIDDDHSKEWSLEKLLKNYPAGFATYIFVYNLQPYHPWPKDGGTLGPTGPSVNFSVQELKEPPVSGLPDPSFSKRATSSDDSGEQLTVTDATPVGNEDDEVEVQAGISLPNLPEASDGEDGKPHLSSRWEGQPAEIVVQVTMGDMVLTGVLRGLLKKGPKRPTLGAKPTGISKRQSFNSPSRQGKKISKSSQVR